jgi:hypothetical protein
MKDRIKSMMSHGIILLIMFFICYTFGGLGKVNPLQPKKIVAFFEMERVNPYQPPKIVAYEGQN